MLILRQMNRILRQFAFVLILLGGASLALSADAPAAKTPQPDRWLIIVDTSAAMERRGKAVEGVAGELLASGMRGEMKPGSDIGIWTFNKELFAGVVPLQTWNPAQSNLIAGRTVNFLAAQKFTGKARMEPVIEELRAVVKDSRRLTVLIFTDGSATFTNTPFDAELNAAIAANKASLAKTRMPLVVVLRSEKGKLIGHNVSLAPWPVEFPAYAPEPEPAPAAKLATSATNRPPREIHISAKPKPEPVVPAITSPALAPTSQPPAVVAKPEPVELAPVNVVKPEPAPSTGAVAAANSPGSVDTNFAAAAKPVAQPSPAPALPPTPAPAPVAVRVEPDPALALAATQPTTPPARSRLPLYAGIGFMTAAALIALILALRGRRAGGSSLITRSFDRQ